MSYRHITVKQLARHIGAEIGEVNLAEEQSDEVIREICQALLTWKVIFFRNRNIDHAAQTAFTALW